MTTRHKYGARPTIQDGLRFASKAEARRYGELKIAQLAGTVLFFLRQPRFDLPGGVRYAADFQVFWTDGSVTFEDVKGVALPAYKAKRRMVEALYPVKIEEVRYR